MKPFRRLLPRIRPRRVLLLIALGLALPFAAGIALREYAALRARDRVYRLDDVPTRPVAIIFGAAVRHNGQPTAMLADRVALGAALYHAGKVDVLLMTGDNHIIEYNEPEAMRRYALRLGVPDEAIVLDYAGFRTYDSCFRARDIFQVESAILVTQDFHLDRALLTCRGLGLDAVGVAADVMRPEGYNPAQLARSELREYPATTVAVLDLLRGRKPRFLGDPLPIAGASSGNSEGMLRMN